MENVIKDEGWEVVDGMGRKVGTTGNGGIDFDNELLLSSRDDPPKHRCRIQVGESVASVWMEGDEVCYRTMRRLVDEKRYITNTARFSLETWTALAISLSGFAPLAKRLEKYVVVLDEGGRGIVTK